jgi:tRNA(adenine34) deaminase
MEQQRTKTPRISFSDGKKIVALQPQKPAMFSDDYYMKQALAEAQKAYDRDEVPVGCVVVCNDRIIARGHNLTEMLNDVTAHAEMQAITAAAGFLGGKYLTDCTLFVTLEPCVMCAGALGWSQISRIVYGASDEKRGFSRFAPLALHPRTIVSSGVMAEECSHLIKQFFLQKRK